MNRRPSTARQAKEAAIFSAALRVIKRQGFHRARMADIAREAGISYGLVYHYFRNKDDLFESILRHWWDGLFQLMARIVQSQADLRSRLRWVIDYFLDHYQKKPELVNIFITEISRSTTNLSPERLEHFTTFMAMTEELMAQGQKAGVLRTDLKARYLTFIFLGALETFISVMVLGDLRLTDARQKERIAESILEVFFNGARMQD